MHVLCAQILDAHVLDAHELKKMLAEKEEKRAIYVYICYVCCCYDHSSDRMLLGYVWTPTC